MIDDLDETIRQLLIAEMPIKNGEVEISFEQPRRENSIRWSRPTVNLFLYDVRENNVLRHHGWEGLPESNGKDILAHQKRTPMRVDCYYMLTTWAAVPEDEHRLLARCLLALFRFPILPQERLVGSLCNPRFDIQARLASHDKLTNPAELWSALDNEIRPSISYMVTLSLDPWSEVSCALVRTVYLQTGQAAGLPYRTGLVEGTQTDMTWVGGKVRDQKQPHTGLEGIEVAIKGSGLVARTDKNGCFILGSLTAGEYILIIWPPSGKPIEKRITVPTKGEAIDRKKPEEYSLEILI